MRPTLQIVIKKEEDELQDEDEIKSEPSSDVEPSKRKRKSRTGKAGPDRPEDDKKPKRARTAGGGKRWTGDELEALLVAALSGGPPKGAFKDAVPGRTTQQCDTTWRRVEIGRIS